jgi:2-phospho-L-lactate guanylyltransferase
MTLHAVIPCKRLSLGKSRLAPVLGAAQRRQLCEAFLTRTLDLAQGLVPASQIHLVTSDPEARGLAVARGIAAIDDPGEGLNAALAAACAAILQPASEASALLVLPTDLPFAGADAVGEVLAAAGDVLIVPDEARSGTNLLVLRGPALHRFGFAFGRDSFHRHCTIAERALLQVGIVASPQLAFDVDGPEDYRRWQAKGRCDR